MKKIILPILIAILAVIAVLAFRWQYDKYVEYSEQQEELNWIEQQKKIIRNVLRILKRKNQI